MVKLLLSLSIAVVKVGLPRGGSMTGVPGDLGDPGSLAKARPLLYLLREGIGRKHLALAVGLGLVGFLSAGEPKRDPQDNVLERFSVAKAGDCLLLPVTYKGKTYQFLLDSGSTYNVFDSSLLLGSPVKESEVQGAADAVRLKYYEAPQAEVGSISLKSTEPAVAFDFTELRQVTGYEVYGVLGMPFLRRNTLRVDFDRGELLVLALAGRDCGEGFAVSYDESMAPHIDISIARGNKEAFLLDTGFNGTGSFAAKSFGIALNKGDLTVAGVTLFQSASGTSAHRIGRLKQLSLGDFVVPDAVVIEGKESLLGLGFCSRFVMTFDLPHNRVYLKKGENFGRPDRYDLSGLHILRKGGDVVVHSVDKRCAAEAAGLQAGDVLLKIGGESCNKMSMFELRNRLSIETNQLRMTIRREGKELEVALVLAPKKAGESERARPGAPDELPPLDNPGSSPTIPDSVNPR